MSFNYGREEKKWRLWKEAEEKQLQRPMIAVLKTIEEFLTEPFTEAIFNDKFTKS